MTRFGFLPGLFAGLLIGLLAGLWLAAKEGSEADPTVARQVEELTQQLATAREERERADRHLERFQRMAEEMTASYKRLEGRFERLAEAARLLEGAETPGAEASGDPEQGKSGQTEAGVDR